MDHYSVLGLSRGATAEQIKAAYRTLALQWHPDRNPDNVSKATEQFKLIGLAFEVLSDPAKKSQYDTNGYVGRRPPNPPPRPSRPPQPPRPQPSQAAAEEVKKPKDPFEDFFSNQHKGYVPPSESSLSSINCSFIEGGSTGRSIITHLHVEEWLLDQGGVTKVKIKRRIACRACSGDGYIMAPCPRCGGHRKFNNEFDVPTWACDVCDGVGAKQEPCRHCKGQGVHNWEIAEVQVTIPPRSKIGHTVLVYGQGEEAPMKAPGNLRVVLV